MLLVYDLLQHCQGFCLFFVSIIEKESFKEELEGWFGSLLDIYEGSSEA